MDTEGGKQGFCPNPDCGCEDEIYLHSEVKLQLTKLTSNYDIAHFYLEDVYVTPKSLQKPGEKHGKFKCENCGHIFDEPAWEK